MDQKARLDYLIDYLLKENTRLNAHKKNTMEEKWKLYRGLVNIRPPKPVTAQFIKIQNALLMQWNHEQPVTSLSDLTANQPQIYLWKGDITSLAVDGIVNAANSNLIGCTQANHHCIDNIIHTRSGVQLRLDCASIVDSQGSKEPIGKAKITEAYNLPADYIIHTVGPFIDQRGITPFKEHLLASCYQSCLALADKHQLSVIAFCCISTGEFNFPNKRAAEIAIQTVKTYLTESQSKLHIIFNVFKEEDLHIYQSLLKQSE